MSLKERAHNLKRDIPAIFLALKREDTPISAKVLSVVTVGYALSPIDFIPDFIPVLGYLDDIIILPILVALTVRAIPSDILTECRKQSEGMWADGKPKKWYYAVPIILVWILIVWIIIKTIWF